MTQLEYFKAWAKERYPGMDQTTDAKALEDGTVLFFHDTLQVAWRAFQYRYTIRPTTTMANGTLNTEEFRKDDPTTIVDRLRGIYDVPIKGQYKTEPILHEAAREIERLREALKPFAAYADHYPMKRTYGNRVTEGEWHSVESGGLGRAQIDVEDFHRAALLTTNKKPAEAG